jgi:RHS repeat-associated protein
MQPKGALEISLRSPFLFTSQLYTSTGSCNSQFEEAADCSDRASYYGADGWLRATDQRYRMGDDNGGYWRTTFEEYRYDARTYDPVTGRFTQEDPIGLAGGINLYGYAGSDPVNSIDPSGNIPVPLITGLIGAGIGAAYGGYRNGWRGALVGAVAGGLAGAGLGYARVGLGVLPATVGSGVSVTFGPLAVIDATGSAATVGASSVAAGGGGATITATGATLAGTIIPKSFTFAAGATRVWVHPNATKHMVELLSRQAASAGGVLREQLLLDSFTSAVTKAASGGIVYRHKYLIDGWEIIFGPPGQTGGLPAVIHALLIP